MSDGLKRLVRLKQFSWNKTKCISCTIGYKLNTQILDTGLYENAMSLPIVLARHVHVHSNLDKKALGLGRLRELISET